MNIGKLFITMFTFFFVIGLLGLGVKFMIMPSKQDVARINQINQCIKEVGHAQGDNQFNMAIASICEQKFKKN